MDDVDKSPLTTREAIHDGGFRLWKYVTLGAYAGILLFLCDGVAHIAPLIGAGNPTWFFFVSAFCATVVCGIFIAVRAVKSPDFSYHLLGVIAGSMAVGGFAVSLIIPRTTLPAFVFIPLGALFGLGIGGLGVGNAIQLGGLSERQFLHCGLIAALSAGILKIVLLMLPAGWLGFGLIGLTIASAILPVNLNPGQPFNNCSNGHQIGSVKGMASRNWVFLTSLILCLLVDSQPWTMVFSPLVNALADALPGRMGTAVGAIFAALVLLLFTRERFLPRLRASMPVIPLLCTASFLVTWYLLVWNDGLNLMGGADSNVGEFAAFASFEFSTILGLFILLWRLRAEVRFGLSITYIYGILSSIIAGLFLLFIVLQNNLLHAVMTGVDSVLRIVFLVVTAIYLWKPAPMPGPAPAGQRIQDAGLKYGLSKREIDILALLVERRNAPYIAEVEYIALSTVKTHIKHIYEKTGVHNRAELLEIIGYSEDEG